MQLRILTPAGMILETECQEAIIPARGGTLGIRKGHTKLVVPIQPGTLTVRSANGSDKLYSIGSGTAEAGGDRLTVLVVSATLV